MSTRTTKQLEAIAKTAKRHKAPVVRLPIWPEVMRGAPNAVLRSALFAAVHGKGRIALDRALLAAQDGITIRYTGWQLSQSDLDVWEQVLHLARTQALGTECQFTEKGFLKALGRQSGKSGRDWLRSSFARLAGAVVELTKGDYTYGGTLLEFYRNENTGFTVFKINPKLAPFFGHSQWTRIGWEQRQLPRGKPLALWLHGFYASHAEVYPLTVEYLHKLSGSQNKELRFFKRHLSQALHDIEAISAIRSFEIRDNLVHVQTAASPSQRKHLASRKLPTQRRK